MSGDELKTRRAALGLSQGRLASLLGIPVNTLARWERGEVRVQHPTILRLALDHLRCLARQDGGE